MNHQTDTSKLVFTASEANAFAVQQIAALRTGKLKGVPFGVKRVDEKMTHWMPGYLVTITARPGHAKTSLALNHANWYQSVLSGIPDNKTACIICCWEQSVENLVLYDFARQTGIPMSKMARGEVDDLEFDSINGAGICHSASGLFYVGFSDRIQGKRPPMTIETVHTALTQIKEWAGPNSYRIGPVYLDYLQRITPSLRTHESKAVAIGAVVDECKELALSWGTQAILTCQAKPQVDTWDDPQPKEDCIEWTNNGDKAGDCNLSLLRPSKYKGEGEMCGDVRVQGKWQLGVQINKQKMGDAPFREWLVFDVSTCQLKGALSQHNLND